MKLEINTCEFSIITNGKMKLEIVIMIKNRCHCTWHKPINAQSLNRYRRVWILIIPTAQWLVTCWVHTHLRPLRLVPYSNPLSHSCDGSFVNGCVTHKLVPYCLQYICYAHFQCHCNECLWSQTLCSLITMNTCMSQTVNSYKFPQFEVKFMTATHAITTNFESFAADSYFSMSAIMCQHFTESK